MSDLMNISIFIPEQILLTAWRECTHSKKKKKNTHVPKLRTFLICKRTITLERLLQENTHGTSQAFLCN